ncbi:MAG: group II intron maturase-specific domain-containing protein [Acidimicrobiales bacterium]
MHISTTVHPFPPDPPSPATTAAVHPSGVTRGSERGWINYYGAFYRSELHSLARRIDEHLVRWAMHKFNRLRGKPSRAWDWLAAARQRQPKLFAHWHLVSRTNGRLVGAV